MFFMRSIMIIERFYHHVLSLALLRALYSPIDYLEEVRCTHLYPFVNQSRVYLPCN